MEKNITDMLPIMAIEHDCILSKQGDITIAYKCVLPEIFTLSDQEYEGLHQAWIKAIKQLPKHSVFINRIGLLQRVISLIILTMIQVS
jgi:Domain of unknown function, B. Theta Gene description (DUF3875)